MENLKITVNHIGFASDIDMRLIIPWLFHAQLNSEHQIEF